MRWSANRYVWSHLKTWAEIEFRNAIGGPGWDWAVYENDSETPSGEGRCTTLASAKRAAERVIKAAGTKRGAQRAAENITRAFKARGTS